MELSVIIEGVLFASARPMTVKQLLGVFRKAAAKAEGESSFSLIPAVTEAQILEALEVLRARGEEPERAFQLIEVAGAYTLASKPAYSPWVSQLHDEPKPVRLSQPALETLAIISYRQPISRADIEGVRGVAVDGVVTTLLERQLIRIAGRSDAPGRPLLYETTPEFLEQFGLRNLDELPNASELRRPAAAISHDKPAAAAPTAAPEAETPHAPEHPAETDRPAGSETAEAAQ